MLHPDVRNVLSLSEARKICREGLRRTFYIKNDETDTMEVEGFDDTTLEFRFFYGTKSEGWKLDSCCLVDLMTLSEFYDLDDTSKAIFWKQI